MLSVTRLSLSQVLEARGRSHMVDTGHCRPVVAGVQLPAPESPHRHPSRPPSTRRRLQTIDVKTFLRSFYSRHAFKVLLTF